MTAGVWGLLGQIVVIFWAIGFAASLLLLAYANWQEERYERDHALALDIDKAFDRAYGKAQLVKAVQKDLADSAFQERARRAESLGFLDEDSAA